MVPLQVPVAVALITLTLVMPAVLIFAVYKLIRILRAFQNKKNESSQNEA